jgi:PBP1b-binding outer membrane lipoprotein LpoB
MPKPIALLIVLALMFLSACQKQQPAKAGNTGAAQQPKTSPWKMTLNTLPEEPVSGQDMVFKVTLANQSGQPVSGADVKADLKMMLMDMGKNEITLADKGSGLYEGKGQFTMSGPWNVIVTASKDGQRGQQAFQVIARK